MKKLFLIFVDFPLRNFQSLGGKQQLRFLFQQRLVSVLALKLPLEGAQHLYNEIQFRAVFYLNYRCNLVAL
jgi:hypothetical protein